MLSPKIQRNSMLPSRCIRLPCMNIDTSSVRYTEPGVCCSGIVADSSPTSMRTGPATSSPVRISCGTVENVYVNFSLVPIPCRNTNTSTFSAISR